MATCYNLAGRSTPFDDTTHVPCNMTAVDAGGHSTCCPVGDLCYTNGMCRQKGDKDSKNWFWRTACTDKTWQDPACPRYCEAIGIFVSFHDRFQGANNLRADQEYRFAVQMPRKRGVLLRLCWWQPQGLAKAGRHEFDMLHH